VIWAFFGLIKKNMPHSKFEHCYFSIRNQPVQKLCGSFEESANLEKGEFFNDKCFVLIQRVNERSAPDQVQL